MPSIELHRLVYGSNWPVSALFAPYDRVHTLAVQLLESRGTDAAHKIFTRNARRFYRLDPDLLPASPRTNHS